MSAKPSQNYLSVLHYIKNVKTAKVEEMSQNLNLSQATVRRILLKLEADGLISRNWGGAMITNVQERQNINYRGKDKVFTERVNLNIDVKQRIAQMAVTFLKDGDSVLLSSGTTTMYVPRFCEAKVMFISNNTSIFDGINYDNVSVMLLGGRYDVTHSSTVGDLAIENMTTMFANHAIIGCSGIHPHSGVSTDVFEESSMNRNMINKTMGKIIVLADGSKIGASSHFQFAQIEQIDILITDDTADKTVLDRFREIGVEIIVV